MPQSTPYPALQRLDALVGAWEFGSPQFQGAHGRTVFEWLEGQAYLVQRSYAPAPSPTTSTWIIGSDDASERYTVLYYDARGVSRVYQMSFGEGVWTVWRDAPGFFQRFTGTFSHDNTSITARWEKSDDGSTWAHDFDLFYTKVR